MKPPRKTALIASMLFALPSLAAVPAPAPVISFTQGSGPAWNIDWAGTGHRIYFLQCSLDLETWMFGMDMEFGTGLKRFGVVPGNVPKFFVRLLYYDDESVETLEQAKNADFDGDGVNNIDEITILGTNPMVFSTDGSGIADGTQDWDGDGISNADEIALGLDPGTDNTDTAAGVAAVDFGYDDAGRLVGVTSPVGTASYSPDEEGNIE